jgi:hypothetical protein
MPFPLLSKERISYPAPSPSAEHSQFAHTSDGALTITEDHFNSFGIMVPGGGVYSHRSQRQRENTTNIGKVQY